MKVEKRIEVKYLVKRFRERCYNHLYRFCSKKVKKKIIFYVLLDTRQLLLERRNDHYFILENMRFAKICCRRVRGRLGRTFGFRGHHRSRQQSLHASGESSAGALAVSRSGDHVRQVLRSDRKQYTADR